MRRKAAGGLLTGEAFTLLLLVRLVLWLTPYRTAAAMCARLATVPVPVGRHEPTEIVMAVQGLSRFIPRASCLTQALAAQVVMGWHGHPARVVLGAERNSARNFAAHAWLESSQGLVIGGFDTQYQDFQRFHP